MDKCEISQREEEEEEEEGYWERRGELRLQRMQVKVIFPVLLS